MHIADINFPEFYAPALGGVEGAKKFFEAINADSSERPRMKTVLHQTARMIWLADRMDEVAKARPALQILFYLTAAELVAKVYFGFEGEGQSRKFVHRFFEEICTQSAQQKLAASFRHYVGGNCLDAQHAIDLLYDIRCDVVHRGRYFTFMLKRSQDEIAMLAGPGLDDIIPEITDEELRAMVLEGAVEAVRKLAGTANVKLPV